MYKTKEYKLHITKTNKGNTVVITKIIKLTQVTSYSETDNLLIHKIFVQYEKKVVVFF